MKAVTRKEFEQQIIRLARGESQEPATALLPTTTRDINGQNQQQAMISFFIENGCAVVNDSARGNRQTYFEKHLPQIQRILDEEEKLAAKKNASVAYQIGRKTDPQMSALDWEKARR
jgi:hypothetical protein